MTLYQNILMWVSLAAAFVLAAAGVVVWCDLREVLPGRRILHAFMRLPWLVRVGLRERRGTDPGGGVKVVEF